MGGGKALLAGGAGMLRFYRVSRHRGDMLGDSESIEGVERIVRESNPGRFHVDEIADRPILAGFTARKWGSAIKLPDGSVILSGSPIESLHDQGDRARI